MTTAEGLGVPSLMSRMLHAEELNVTGTAILISFCIPANMQISHCCHLIMYRSQVVKLMNVNMDRVYLHVFLSRFIQDLDNRNH